MSSPDPESSNGVTAVSDSGRRRRHRRPDARPGAPATRAGSGGFRAGSGAGRDRRGGGAVGQLDAGAAPPWRARPGCCRVHRADRADLPELAGRKPHRRPSRPTRPALPGAFRRTLFRHPPRRPATHPARRARRRGAAPGTPAAEPRRRGRRHHAQVCQRPVHAGGPRGRGGRRALGHPRVGRRGRGHDLLRDQRLPRHRAGRAIAGTAGPAGHPVLDWSERAPAALRDRRRGPGCQLLRGDRGSASLARCRVHVRHWAGRGARRLQGLAPGRHRDDRRRAAP